MPQARWLATWLLATVALAGPGWAQAWKGTGRLEGRVLDAAGRPVPGATVRLLLTSRGGGTFVAADAAGRWTAAGLAGGDWTIDIEAEGYASRRVSA